MTRPAVTKPMPTQSPPHSELDLRDEEIIEQLTETARFISAVSEGLADSEMGRLVSDEDLGHELEAMLGVPADMSRLAR